MARKLTRSFYARDAQVVAPELIGCILVHRSPPREYRARIVETEAYVGEHDLACHAAKGRTQRTEVMFGRPGHAYVYFIYGIYDMFNIVCAPRGDAQAVLIRAAEPLGDWPADLSGPGKLCREMEITRKLNGADLTGKTLYLLPREAAPAIAISKRIGIAYAKEWQHAPLRFYDSSSIHVSGRRVK